MGSITATTGAAIWKEIELAESYLVCSMFEEAASLASSILKCIHDHGRSIVIEEEACDMLESTGMVLVQSLKELGRTSEILIQLRLSFVSVKSVPAQVFLTGCLWRQMPVCSLLDSSSCSLWMTMASQDCHYKQPLQLKNHLLY